MTKYLKLSQFFWFSHIIRTYFVLRAHVHTDTQLRPITSLKPPGSSLKPDVHSDLSCICFKHLKPHLNLSAWPRKRMNLWKHTLTALEYTDYHLYVDADVQISSSVWFFMDSMGKWHHCVNAVQTECAQISVRSFQLTFLKQV